MDAFSAQIVKFVREMPDEALLELVKQKLGVLGAAVGRRNAALAGSPARAAAGPKSVRAAQEKLAPPPASPAERQKMLDEVERIVKEGAGLSASDVARAARLPQTRVAAALKELKLAKRIYQGGDRRFARYAGDARTAEQASDTARKNAKGPVARPKAAAPGKGRKRAA
jgi:DNA-binding IclR family transcriptional regulator